MNKTVSCNISGIIFNLEENAYATLNTYLTNLRTHLRNVEGSDEIYADIESRIAELFSGKLGVSKEVITEADVDEVIRILGNPEEYIDEDAEDSEGQNKEKETKRSESAKVFMRDPDNGVIAGVCTGISAYFGVDLTLVRGLFVLLFFLTGFGLGLYIVLWIIAPRANSSADKLRMRGKPINIDSIKREVHEAAERVERYSKSKATRQKFETIKDRTNRFGRALGSIIGLFLIIGAAFGIITFLTVTLTEVGIFSSDDGERLISLYEFSDVIFRSDFQSFLGWTGLLGTVLIPMIAFIIMGMIMLLHIRSQWSKYVFILLTIFWFVSIGILTVTGLQVGSEFSSYKEIDESIGQVTSSKLVINVPEVYGSDIGKVLEIDDEEFSNRIQMEDENIKSGFVALKFVPSEDSLFHIKTVKSSYGITSKKALSLSNNIIHDVHLDSNQLTVYPYYLFPADDKLRGQHVQVYVAVPVGGEIDWIGNKKQLNISNRSSKIEFETRTVEVDID